MKVKKVEVDGRCVTVTYADDSQHVMNCSDESAAKEYVAQLGVKPTKKKAPPKPRKAKAKK